MAKAEIQELTQECLKRHFGYDPATGHMVRIKSVQGAPSGQLPYPHSNGYLRIRFAGGMQLVHRLAWLYVHGEMPPEQIDHIDGNRSNNRIENLRLATNAQNSQNNHVAKGVSFYKPTGVWRCRLNKAKQCIVNSYHKTYDEARSAYLEAKRQHHEFAVIA
jgi:HNH endonuclease